MDFLKSRELLILKPSSKKSCIDYVTYDSQNHVLCVGMKGNRFIYMGVPESLYCHMAVIAYPDDLFRECVFNRYPVVIEPESSSEALRKRRRRYSQRMTRQEPPPSDDDSH